MKTPIPFAAGLVLAALLIAPTAFAHSEGTDLNRVEVRGQRPAGTPRVDVHESCAHLEETLQRPLDIAAFREGQTGTVRVEFELEDGKAVDVSTFGGPQVYRGDIRHAMHLVSCSGGDHAGAGQRYAMLIDFVAPNDETLASAGTHMALREIKDVTQQ